jgi:hypothetical protein
MPTAVLQIRKEPYYRRAAFESGLKRLGYTITDKAGHPASKADVLVVWNIKNEAETTLWEQRGGTVVVSENGYLAQVDKTYYALSLHGHNGSGTFPVSTEDRFSKLGFEVKPRQDGPVTLVCGQRGIGSRLMASPPQWAEKMVTQLKRQGAKYVRLRSHPGNFAPKVPLLTDLRDVGVCMIWSSGAGVRALVEGVTVKHFAPHWICEGWETDGVGVALHKMSHGQWHHEEIATGEPFARLLSC